MSAPGAEIAVVVPGGTPTLDTINGLIQWVLDAPVEEVCWRITEVGSMRQWLQAQKAATELRIRAVRLELVALRKVGCAGLDKKIAGSAQLQHAARWLASLTDDEFAVVLTEIDGERSPIALYRADKAERDAMADAMREGKEASDWQRRTDWARRRRDERHVRDAASDLLETIVEEGKPFTVSEAASRLASLLNLDVEVQEATAEGLREMVRSAIRRGARSVSIDPWSELPVAFTFARPDGTYVRVPAVSATLGHLLAHEREVRDRAEAALSHADKLGELLARLVLEVTGKSVDELLDTEDQGAATFALRLSPMVDRLKRTDGWTSKNTSRQERAA